MKIERGGLYPVNAPHELLIPWIGKIPLTGWHDLAEERSGKTLRQLAEEYGVSHETVRRALRQSVMSDFG
jgi:hypothetical protein